MSCEETASNGASADQQYCDEFTRDDDLWMEDGNIIIAATDETAYDSEEEPLTYVFKCHKSVLSRQSSIFNEMLCIPPSKNVDDICDGLPLVTLPDPYQDVKAALHLLYEPE